MRVRWFLGAVVAALALSTADPAVACPQDLYSGNWLVGSRYKEKGKTVESTYGLIAFTFDSEGDERTILGQYDFSGKGGSFTASLDVRCGRKFSGRYRDPKGAGRFEAELQSDVVSFEGRARDDGGSWLPWWGRKL
jgi:hypothetical protein